MSRLEITAPDKAQLVIEGLYKDLERRIESSPPGLCPVDMTRAFPGDVSYTHLRKMCAVPYWSVAAEEPADRCSEWGRNYGNIRPDGRTCSVNHGRS